MMQTVGTSVYLVTLEQPPRTEDYVKAAFSNESDVQAFVLRIPQELQGRISQHHAVVSGSIPIAVPGKCMLFAVTRWPYASEGTAEKTLVELFADFGEAQRREAAIPGAEYQADLEEVPFNPDPAELGAICVTISIDSPDGVVSWDWCATPGGASARVGGGFWSVTGCGRTAGEALEQAQSALKWWRTPPHTLDGFQAL